MQLIGLFQSQQWQVAVASAAAPSPHAVDLTELGVTTHPIVLNHASFDSFVSDLQPDLVVFDRFVTEEQFGWRVAAFCPSALRVLDTIDLHCLRLARQSAVKNDRPLSKEDLFSETAKREIAAIYRCDLSLMISSFEIELLQTAFRLPPHLLHYTPFLVAPPTLASTAHCTGFDARTDFMTIGNFLHEPNWDSVRYLKQKVWPLVRQRLPKAVLQVYGSYATQKVFDLHNPADGFFIRGRAADAGEVMQQARVCLAPLRFGAGMKGKLLDAMLYGTPSVTTPVGAEGMHGDLPWNGAVADTPEEIAAAAVALYQDEDLWRKAQANGFHLLNSHFSMTHHGPLLLQRLTDLATTLKEHRQENFTGAMLQHQQLAATKYMALWIEAKQKKEEHL